METQVLGTVHLSSVLSTSGKIRDHFEVAGRDKVVVVVCYFTDVQHFRFLHILVDELDGSLEDLRCCGNLNGFPARKTEQGEKIMWRSGKRWFVETLNGSRNGAIYNFFRFHDGGIDKLVPRTLRRNCI